MACVQAPKKKIRLGLPATQWITIYNAHRPMKQRYHYNVANTRVDQHVEKGNDDGLYISSVACCHELWALIMDAGTGFSAQVSYKACKPCSPLPIVSMCSTAHDVPMSLQTGAAGVKVSCYTPSNSFGAIMQPAVLLDDMSIRWSASSHAVPLQYGGH